MSERLDPLSLEGINRHNLRAAAHFFAHEFNAAIDAAERATGRAPDYNTARCYLIASLAHAGRIKEVRDQATRAQTRLQSISPRVDERVLS